MKSFLGENWEITPAGGQTGDAYIAQSGNEKIFLKRNSSPFLAVLSAEGIVPKLLWTKRLENGDVITAQRWLNGRELKPREMNHEAVAHLLKKIHHSSALLAMLERLGKKKLTPQMMLADLRKNAYRKMEKSKAVDRAFDYLAATAQQNDIAVKVVCHCDLNHNNWLLSEENELYLIDWDHAHIADPAVDLGMLLYSYIRPEEWKQWLNTYGISLSESLQKRMHWYFTAQTLSFLFWHRRRGEASEAEEMEERLASLLSL